MSDVMNSPARSRIESLLDENSFVELGAMVTSRSTDFSSNEKKASDGVITGHGLIDGKLVFVYSQDPSVLNGTIGEMHAKKILSVYDMALKMGAPVIGIIDSKGVRLQESVDALESMGAMIAKAVKASGVVSQIAVVYNCGGGLSALPSMADFVFVEKNGSFFVNSPDTIEGNSKEKLNTASAEFQFKAGNADFIGDEASIFEAVRSLFMLLPGSNMENGNVEECLDDLNRASDVAGKTDNLAEFMKELSDNHVFFEAIAGYAKSLVTGLIKLNGMTVGVVGNQNEILTSEACEKATAFVKYCDAFDIPVLTLTNLSGYESSVDGEMDLMHQMSLMAAAFAGATVPKINLIIKKAVGSAYVLMNSKSLGADLTYAFPDAEMGIMDAGKAAKILSESLSGEIGDIEADFEKNCSGVENAGRRGYIDRIINPEDARKYLIAGFEMLFNKSDETYYKKHSAK